VYRFNSSVVARPLSFMSRLSSNSPARPPITDSPWFWLAVFSLGGIAAVLLIEQQYRRQAAGEVAARAVGDEGDAPPPTERELIIPLWPLIGACLLMFALSIYMIWRRRTTLTIFEDEPARDEP
jgi:hypothetical protein